VVRNGTYQQRLNLTRTGTAANPIRWISENRWGAVIDNNYNSQKGIDISGGVHHQIIQGFRVTRAGLRSGDLNGRGIDAGSGSNYITIRDCQIDNCGNNVCSGIGDRASIAIGMGRSDFHWVIERNLMHNIGRLGDGSCRTTTKVAAERDHALYLRGYFVLIQNNIFFQNEAGWNYKIDHGTFITPPNNARVSIVINNTFASIHRRQRGQIRNYRNPGTNRATHRNALLINNVHWGSVGGAVAVGGGGWPNPGFEVINNISNTAIVEYSSNATSSHWNSGCRRLHGNISNVSGNMGMRSPKVRGAVETDFEIVNPNSPLIGAGLASYADVCGRGIPTVVAPAVDFWGRPRPSVPSLGAFEYFGG
jgi:hypothetical protein